MPIQWSKWFFSYLTSLDWILLSTYSAFFPIFVVNGWLCINFMAGLLISTFIFTFSACEIIAVNTVDIQNILTYLKMTIDSHKVTWKNMKSSNKKVNPLKTCLLVELICSTRIPITTENFKIFHYWNHENVFISHRFVVAQDIQQCSFHPGFLV